MPCPSDGEEGVTFESLMPLLEQEAKDKDVCKKLTLLPVLDQMEEGVFKCWSDDKPLNLDGGFLWLEGEPNGEQYENCTTFRNMGTADRSCIQASYCFYCQFEGTPWNRALIIG